MSALLCSALLCSRPPHARSRPTLDATNSQTKHNTHFNTLLSLPVRPSFSSPMHDPSRLVIQPLVMSPVGPEGLTSPLTPTTFTQPDGPHARPAARANEAQHQQQQQFTTHAHNQADPFGGWGAAASNPFPHSSGGVTATGYYQAPQSAVAHPRVQYDPNTSSFTIPSGGGGMSPPPNGYLPTAAPKQRGGHANTIALIKSFILGKSNFIKLCTVGGMILTLVLIFLVVRGRSVDSVDSPVHSSIEASRTSGVESDSRPPTGSLPHHLNHRKRDEGGYESQKQADHAEMLRAKARAARKEKSQLQKGIDEISKLKANLKEMKQKLKDQIRSKADEMKKAVLGKREVDDDDAAQPEESESPESDIDEVKQQLAVVQKEMDDDDSDTNSSSKSPSKPRQFDWDVGAWSDCSVSCDSGVQTRDVVCRHTATGERVNSLVCSEYTASPPDVMECRMQPCVKDEMYSEEDADVPPPQPATISATKTTVVESAPDPSTAWPTLSQYPPSWSSMADDSCPALKWGLDFIVSKWYQTREIQCGVDMNPDEHGSLELITFPSENLPHDYVSKRTAADLAADRVNDSFMKIRHGLFHPTAVRYSTGAATKRGKSTIKEVVSKSDPTGDQLPDWAISLDCTARPELQARSHPDETTQTFLQSLHFLNPHAPPLVTPSDPRSKSIFTRAFERMTDKEFETTTIMMHRNCPPPFSPAQCMGDLFAVYAIAHTIQVEFSSIRIVFLDDGDETPYFQLWQKLFGTTSVFTRQMWSELRIAPFDEDDVYLTNAIFVIPTMVPALFTLGESILNMPVNFKRHHDAIEANKCVGPSALHIGFNSLVADLYLGQGAASTTDADRANSIRAHLTKHVGSSTASEVSDGHDASHNHPLLIVVAGGGGGTGTPGQSGFKLSNGGMRLMNHDELMKSLGRAYPSTKIQPYPRTQSFSTQLQLLTHASVLIAVRNSIAFNTLLFTSHPETLHVVELVSKDEPTLVEQLDMTFSQGMTTVPDHVARWAVAPTNEDAIFNAKRLCERIGCASYTSLLVPGDHAEASVSGDAALYVLGKFSSRLPLDAVQQASEPTLQEFEPTIEEAKTIKFAEPTENEPTTKKTAQTKKGNTKADAKKKATTTPKTTPKVTPKATPKTTPKPTPVLTRQPTAPPSSSKPSATKPKKSSPVADPDMQEPAASLRAIEGTSPPKAKSAPVKVGPKSSDPGKVPLNKKKLPPVKLVEVEIDGEETTDAESNTKRDEDENDETASSNAGNAQKKPLKKVGQRTPIGKKKLS